MPDIYRRFDELLEREGQAAFNISTRTTPSGAAIIAPHGGKIEFLTSELTKAIAGNEFSFYSFEGNLKNDNKRLHITSENFDEPKANEIVQNAAVIVVLHGRKDKYGREAPDPETIWLGGLDRDLIQAITDALTSAGFKSTSSQKYLKGEKPNNICNRGATHAGAQLEIPHSLRSTLRNDKGSFFAFVEAIRKAIKGRIARPLS
jgi:phage replication-related protein YjqB (UPF0714/DUF867 family)